MPKLGEICAEGISLCLSSPNFTQSPLSRGRGSYPIGGFSANVVCVRKCSNLAMFPEGFAVCFWKDPYANVFFHDLCRFSHFSWSNDPICWQIAADLINHKDPDDAGLVTGVACDPDEDADMPHSIAPQCLTPGGKVSLFPVGDMGTIPFWVTGRSFRHWQEGTILWQCAFWYKVHLPTMAFQCLCQLPWHGPLTHRKHAIVLWFQIIVSQWYLIQLLYSIRYPCLQTDPSKLNIFTF